MRIALLIALAACGAGGDDYPVGPGGSMGPIQPGGSADARVDGATGDGAPDAAMTSGRVCLVTDLRALATCAATGAGGLTVTLGAATATTTDTGAFSIATQSGTGLTWHVTGGTITPSVMPVTAVPTIPAIDATAYGDLVLGQTGAAFVPGRGSLVARVVDATGAPAAGATATDTPAPADAILYDGASPTSWTQLGTSAYGVVWIPHAIDGANTLDVTPQTGSDATVTATVEDVSITFVTVSL